MTHAERHWASVLNEAWGIDAVLQPLPGEFELNFLRRARLGGVWSPLGGAKRRSPGPNSAPADQ